MVKVVTTTEGDVDGTYEFDTLAEATAFSSGFSNGAGCYGAGSACGYVEGDADELADLKSNCQEGYKRKNLYTEVLAAFAAEAD